MTALSLLLLTLNLSHPEVPIYSFWIENVLFSVGFSTVGAVIVPRLSRENRTGWLFCAIGLLWAMAHFSAEYATYGLLSVPGSLPVAGAVSWFYSWPPILALGLSAFLVLLFPNGRLPGEGWGWFARLSALSTLVGAILMALSPGPIGAGLPIRNAIGIEGLPTFYRPVQALMFVLVVVSVASLLVRRLRAGEVERLQTRWFAFAFALGGAGVILKYLISDPLDLVWLGRVGYALDLIGTAGIPISMGIAITRYRLYEIDLLINRALVYGALTAMLVGIYVGGVVSLQYVFRALTGNESQVAIVASTLAIAAVFYPLRNRVQGFVDRRFYRRKYDAARMLETFNARLRDETDLHALGDDLIGVVSDTVQQTHASIWLRPDIAPEGEQLTNGRP